MSLRLKAFPCPATSEGSDTLSPAVLRIVTDTQQPTQSRYEVCEMSGLAPMSKNGASSRARRLFRIIVALLFPVLLAQSYGKKEESTSKSAGEKEPIPTSESFAERRLKEIVQRQESIFRRIEEKKGEYHEGDLEDKIGSIANQYEEYLHRNPQDVIAYILYGKLLNKIGQEEHAVRQFLSADQLDPKIAVVKQQLGNYMAEHGKFEEALGFFLDAIVLSPESALYHYQIAEIMNTYSENILLSGMFDRAELDRHMQEAFSKAASLDVNNRQFQYRYAESFYDVEAPDWEKALSLWGSLQEKSQPGMENDAVLLHRAYASAELGRFEEARKLAEMIEFPALQISRQEVLDKVATVSEKLTSRARRAN